MASILCYSLLIYVFQYLVLIYLITILCLCKFYASFYYQYFSQILFLQANHTSSFRSQKPSFVSSYNSNSESLKEKLERPASAPIFHTFSPLTVSKPKPASVSLLEKKIEKLLKSVADGDIQMVSATKLLYPE